MIARLVCWFWGHRRGPLVDQAHTGRAHRLTFVCDRCHRAFVVAYRDPS